MPKQEMIYRAGKVDTKNIDKEERRVPIVISTEAPIRECTWRDGCYPRILKHTKESVVINRDNIKLLNQHNKYSLSSTLGRLENIRIDGDVLRADAIFSKANPDAEIPWQMVQEKTLDEISVGGVILEKEVKRDGNNKIIEEIVTKWELVEASLVVIGADANAGVNRNQKGEKVNIEDINRRLNELSNQIKTAKDEKVAIELQAEQSNLEIEKIKIEKENLEREIANRDRKDKILNLARTHNLDEKDEMVKRVLEDEAKTEKDLAMELLNRSISSQKEISSHQRVAGGGVQNEAELQRAISDSLILRAGIKIDNPHQDVNRFATASLLDMARMLTGMEMEFNREAIVQRAMTTDAFPNLLGSVIRRTLSKGWAEAGATYDQWTNFEYFQDFRPKNFIDIRSGFGTFERIREKGERKYVQFGEDSRSWSIDSYGEKLVFTRQMLINDDLGALLEVVAGIGEKGKRTINTHVYDLLLGEGLYKNYKMGDNKALFHADHKNIVEASAFSDEAVEAMDILMGNQTLVDGKKELPLNITPEYLLVGRINNLKARKLLTSTADISANNAGVTNPFYNMYKLVVEQRLDKSYFLAAKRRTISVGFLNGNTDHMPIVQKTAQNLDGMEYNIVLDFGVTAEDFRGLVKNQGE